MYEFTNFIFLMSKKYKVIGIMSGTSLDGLDIAYCEFVKGKNFALSNPHSVSPSNGVTSFGGWKYKIIHAETKKYSKEWKEKLSKAFSMKKKGIEQLDKEYGKYIGREVQKFIRHKKIVPDFISSHGHTLFHQPEKKITLQIGDGNTISSACRLPVVCDFRSGDVALGGQGAPLVPMADKLLFSQYDFCLNLGGFANISYNTFPLSKGEGLGVRRAFDICPVNIVLNELANKCGKEFDEGGKMASKGKVHSGLLKKLNKLPFYRKQAPKSLGREWAEKVFLPTLNSFSISTQDKLRTVVEHVAAQIALIANVQQARLLITGGGAYNRFLVKRISEHTQCEVILPDNKTIQFKEAMAFGFLGVLRIRKDINILKSVTGAARDSSGGKIFFPDQNAFSSL